MENKFKFLKFTFVLVIILMLMQALNVQSQVIGNNAEGTLTDPPANTMCSIRYQCVQDMTVSKMYAKIAVSGSGNIKCAIYADSIGTPGTFLMGTNELTNPSTGWQSFDLTSGLSLTSGTWYHLVLWTDNTGYLINYTADGVGTPYSGLDYGPWPDPYPTTGPWTGGTYCIYAEAPSTIILGNNAEGTLTDPPANTMCSIRYQCVQDMTISKMYAKIAVSGSGNIKCAIYSDSDGNPGSFLMGTNELTNPGTGWQSFYLTSGLSLTSGTWYHLVLWTDNTGYLINYTADGVGTPYSVLDYGPWPDPYPTTGPWTGGTYCLYAESGTCTNPSITTQPQSIVRSVGQSATFRVKATGTSLLYQWEKGGTDIQEATLSSYTINSVESRDAGGYAVVVSGACGSPVTSETVSLTLCDNPVAITAQPQSIERNTGTSAMFNVTATGAGLTYQWRKGGTNLPGATGPTYTLSSITNGDAGDYTVIVSGTCGSPVTSSVASLLLSDYIIQGQTFTNSEEIWTGVNIERATKKAFYFLNNSITSKNTSGYMLQAGDEATGANNNNLDGAVIAGNKFTWGGTNGQGGTHGLFTGYNKNVTIKYNYLDHTPSGIQMKSFDMVNTSGGVAYNIIIDPELVAIPVKSMAGTKIYNNTFYSEQQYGESQVPGTTSMGLVDIYINDDHDPHGIGSTGTLIKNNIFYTKYQIPNIDVVDDSSAVGLVSDYNLFYCEAGTPYFKVKGVLKTFAQWQALGYDTHSVVINPNFIGNTLIPSVPLYHGKDLGDEWEQGLSPSAEWGTSAPAVAKQDSSIWQCGAYVVFPAPVADYYVAPYGSDNNAGTISAPFYSLNKVWTVVQSGNLVYMRGGTYAYDDQQVLEGKNGTSGNLIKVWAYPGETPIITKGTNYTADIGVYFNNNDYVHLKGLTIAGFTQKITGGNFSGLRVDNSSNCIFEQLNYHHNGFPFNIVNESTNNLVLNCDFHHQYDPYTVNDAYGNGDGTDCPTASGTTNTFRGCRSWNNSDDGYDFWAADGVWIIENCWAWSNGYKEDGETRGGDGNGFKLGRCSDNAGTTYATTHLRTVTNCVSFHNRLFGFSDNALQGINWIYNNTAWHNGDGTSFCASYAFGTVPNNILKNNIAFENQNPGGSGNEVILHATTTHTNNTWNGIVTLSTSDFASFDSTGVSGTRQSNGSLSVLNFLHLASGSDLIGAGVDVGLPFSGTAPDIGAFEYTGENQSPSIMNQSFQIDEYSPDGTVVGTIVASDPDEDQTLEYSILSGNTSGAFVINDSTGVLSVTNGAALDIDFSLVVKVQDNYNFSSQATITINIIPTGIESTGINSTIKVYPNPVSDELIIDIEGNIDRQGFEILNSIGYIIFKGNLSERTVVSTTNFSPGVYFIKLQNGKFFEFKKIIKVQ